jgi:hypothetical protein
MIHKNLDLYSGKYQKVQFGTYELYVSGDATTE